MSYVNKNLLNILLENKNMYVEKYNIPISKWIYVSVHVQIYWIEITVKKILLILIAARSWHVIFSDSYESLVSCNKSPQTVFSPLCCVLRTVLLTGTLRERRPLVGKIQYILYTYTQYFNILCVCVVG